MKYLEVYEPEGNWIRKGLAKFRFCAWLGSQNVDIVNGRAVQCSKVKKGTTLYHMKCAQ